MQTVKRSKTPLWRKSMLESLNLRSIKELLWEIAEDGDSYGYEDERSESGYYVEYKEQFDELSACAINLIDAMEENSYAYEDCWDDMTVALLGLEYDVLGYDAAEYDYFKITSFEESLAVEEAEKRIMRMTKQELVKSFRKVLTILLLFFDIKSSHDCLVSIVEELDERGAILSRKNSEINRLYTDLTGKNAEQFDFIVNNLPQRMWVE